MSRRSCTEKGLYTVVFDDSDEGRVLGCFTPMGKTCCYYPSGSLQLLTDNEGGRLFDEVTSDKTLIINAKKQKKTRNESDPGLCSYFKQLTLKKG